MRKSGVRKSAVLLGAKKPPSLVYLVYKGCLQLILKLWVVEKVRLHPSSSTQITVRRWLGELGVMGRGSGGPTSEWVCWLKRGLVLNREHVQIVTRAQPWSRLEPVGHGIWDMGHYSCPPARMYYRTPSSGTYWFSKPL